MAITYNIRLGIPEMARYWENMNKKEENKTLTKDEGDLFKKVKKAFRLLKENPKYPGLQSHEIDALTKREKFPVYESYLENNTPSAGRIFWTYGPDKGDITVLGIVPHPEKGSYGRVSLSGKPAKAVTQEEKPKSKCTIKRMKKKTK